MTFQSTLPRGERHFPELRLYHYDGVSIHAPAGGATKRRTTPQSSHRFQSTLPRGERLLMASIPLVMLSFNPRSRGGSDMPEFLGGISGVMFQSTLPRGERLLSIQNICSVLMFQSTLPRGERRDLVQNCEAEFCFNPRSRGGSDPRDGFSQCRD